MRKSRRETDSFTVSFLDVASCGFGAMIILLMIVKPSTPEVLEISDLTPEASVTELREQLFEIRGETTILNRELNAKHEQLSALTERIARLRRDLNDVEGRFNASNQLSDEITDEIGRLAIARQTLTEEMQRLLANVQSPEDNAIGGVPVDSEYIIFIIDTSGSMYNTPGNWNKLLETIDNTLDVYPEVKGIQIMSDQGDYMFNSYRNQWIPDTPGRRNQIISTLRTWQPFSNSSPVEGVTQAISTYYSPDRKISIYVLGDDFNGYELAALWDDATYGIRHWSNISHIAIVTDNQWPHALMTMFAPPSLLGLCYLMWERGYSSAVQRRAVQQSTATCDCRPSNL